jgi:bacterioferritin
LELLHGALATEWICVLRYTQHYHAAQGLHAEPVAAEFKEHAEQEREHALRLAERIKQLGGQPSLDPIAMARHAHSEYRECDNLLDMIRENLVAERIAVAAYQEMVRFFGNDDPTSRKLVEEILATEEEHADEMADLLKAIDPEAKLG